MKILQERLKSARKFLELSQSELAKKTGLTPAWISHFETGQRKPAIKQLIKMSLALCVTTDHLLGLTSPDGEDNRIKALESEGVKSNEEFMKL